MKIFYKKHVSRNCTVETIRFIGSNADISKVVNQFEINQKSINSNDKTI